MIKMTNIFVKEVAVAFLLVLMMAFGCNSQSCQVSNCVTCSANMTNNCTQCDSSSELTPTNNNFNYCVLTSLPTISIILIILTCILFVIICIRCIYLIVQRYRGGVDQNQPNHGIGVVIYAPPSEQNFMDAADLNNYDPNVQWKLNSISENEKLTGQCCICLSDKVNIQTKCGHMYHDECLIEWLNRKGSCPLCATIDLNPVTFYCLGCKQNHIEIDIRYLNRFTLHEGRVCYSCLR